MGYLQENDAKSRNFLEGFNSSVKKNVGDQKTSYKVNSMI